MSTPSSTIPDRRQRRRQETISEVLDIAAEIMVEQGVVGLSVGEVARRMGIRPPSLYVYFPSKHAMYDALFARGARLLADHLRADAETSDDHDGRSFGDVLLRASEVFVRWSIEHPAYTQLLFWRPVPGFTPSADAYAPAVEIVEFTRSRFAALQQSGLVRDDADIDAVLRDWTVLISGVISQHLSNSPDAPFESGQFTAGLPDLVAMFTRHYGAATSSPPARPTKEARNARKR